MRLQAVLYRGHDPQWAFSPLSGDGAKAKGGRFNPIGVPALYLGATIDTVIVEMTHGFARRLEPLTMVSYDVDIEDIVDLRRGDGRRAAGVKSVDMACPWELNLADGREPASWRVRIDCARRLPAYWCLPSPRALARTCTISYFGNGGRTFRIGLRRTIRADDFRKISSPGHSAGLRLGSNALIRSSCLVTNNFINACLAREGHLVAFARRKLLAALGASAAWPLMAPEQVRQNAPSLPDCH